MLFGKYHIVIFKDGGKGGSRKLRIRGWFGWLTFLGTMALIACNVWLWSEYQENAQLGHKLAASEKTREEQNVQILSLLGKMDEVSDSLNRVMRFDAKLRYMMDEDHEAPEVIPQAREDIFSGALPLHRPTLMARKMQNFLRHLAEDVQLEEVNQQDLLQQIRLKKATLLSTPSIWPVTGLISSSFGMRRAPFTGKRSFHKGIDITGRIGTPIVATAEGTVKRSGHDGAYGISVEIEHGTGILTKYAHLQRSAVKAGQWVRRGQVIGFIGMTGRTTGAHLHYEVRVGGVPVNPMRYILE